MRCVDTVILIRPLPGHQPFVDILSSYYGLIGTIITVLVAWIAITRKIKFSTLHEKRAKLVEKLFELVSEAGQALSRLENERSGREVRAIIDSLSIALAELWRLKIFARLYFGRKINDLIVEIHSSLTALRVAMEDAPDGMSPEEASNQRNKIEKELDAVALLEDSLRHEFRKLLGLDTLMKRMLAAVASYASCLPLAVTRLCQEDTCCEVDSPKGMGTN